MTYSDKLRDPRWQKRRLEILERDKWTCQACKRKDQTLHVHHRYYYTNIDPWEYHDDFLVTLCVECHNNPVIDRLLAIMDIEKLIAINIEVCSEINLPIVKLLLCLQEINSLRCILSEER